MASEAESLSAEIADRRRMLRQCMLRLTDREREMLGRRYDLEQSIKEIAVDFGQSPGAVATNLYRIRNDLLSCIQKSLADDHEDKL